MKNYFIVSMVIVALCCAQVSAQTCTATTCNAPAGTCIVDSTNPCQSCSQSALNNCINKNKSNNTAVCICYDDNIACANAGNTPSCYSRALNFYSSCTTDPAGCSCIAPVPVASSTCRADSFCDSATSICTQYKALGAACTNNNECGNPLNPQDKSNYQCTGSVCVLAAGQMLVGDPCTSNNDCKNSPAVTCTNAICTGVAAGLTCASSAECAIGLYCNRTNNVNVCAAQIATGGTCSANGDCVLGNTCVGSVCVASYSKSAGQTCSSSTECAAGLYCDGTVCATLAPVISCTTNTDCVSPAYTGTCNCNADGSNVCIPTSGVTNEPSVVTSLINLNQCLLGASCRLNYASGSCASKNCGQQLLCYGTTYVASYQSIYKTSAGCSFPPVCGLNAASSAQYGLFLILASLLVAMML